MSNLLHTIGKLKLSMLFAKGRMDKPAIFAAAVFVFVASNLLLQPFSFKADFSKGNAYTLSHSTKNILRSLDDIVNITFYVSSNLPTRLIPLKTEVNDLLNEYKKESGNKVTVTFADPKQDEKAANQVKELGIPELQFSQLEQDKYQLATAYFGMGIAYEDKKEALPQATDIGNLEYNITSLIYRLSRKEPDKVAIAGAPVVENPQQDPYLALKSVLATQYEVSDIDLANKEMKEINPGYKGLILIAPGNSAQLTEETLGKLNSFIKKGGDLLVLTDGVQVNEDLSTAPVTHGLSGFLKEHGIVLNNDLILSTSAELVNFGNSSYQFFTPYPFWIKTSNFNKEAGYFANISSLTFPWTSSLGTVKNKAAGLVNSPPSSWNQKEKYDLYPQNITEPQTKNLKNFTLIAQTKTQEKGSVTVIPSSRFLDARYLSNTAGNIELSFNILNDLISEGALTGIRSRSVNIYPLPAMNEAQKNGVKYGNMLALPALFALYGAVRLFRRK